MFVDVGIGSRLDITDYAYFDGASTTPPWAMDQETGEIKTGRFIDFGDGDLASVRSIMSASGSWSLDENGKLIVKEIETEKLKVGTSEKPNGITLYDSATQQPYCLRITNGTPVSAEGECSSENISSPAPAQATPPPAENPPDNQAGEPSDPEETLPPADLPADTTQETPPAVEPPAPEEELPAEAETPTESVEAEPEPVPPPTDIGSDTITP
ncbi:hypothetical protein A2949_03260 [Candidatus Adlerbacteria bacterium RIFCSPLOWO2_01_FULL_54_21b]|uniref:Uncharacterized protein n=1 Tax=Candidatus Adlerbacteria bacterium RIFCSPLOWO2_01_FULL_54_21b TaxID=1797245 RepID=A0A1F4XX70_9BACT|nr:MAG: hypothetical protein A2949_03260 [Candidatus Adlerbacteria bacterium RIFCSPLOWO2_01_FULL_54_21b]